MTRPGSGLRPFSIKAKLGTLVVVSVFITTGLLIVALRTRTEFRFITVFSVIATLLITQFVAHGLTAPLDEMRAVARSISHGDYTRRVSGAGRRDELGDLAQTINRMADDLEAEDRHRKELVANVSHELRTPIAALRAVLENVVDGVSAADPETMRTALKQTERLGSTGGDPAGPLPAGQRGGGHQGAPLRGVALPVGRAEGGESRSLPAPPLLRFRQPLPYGRPSASRRVTARADGARGRGTPAPGGRQPHRQRRQAQPPHGRVTVLARRGEYPESLELEVVDEGPGIPEAERHRVFERFNRGQAPSPHGPGSDGGTGLGLAIARWAVDLHGGRIGVAESARGCRIQVTLPGMHQLHD